MTTKRCSSCKEPKELKDFNKATHRKDGLQTHCRECGKEKAKRYYKSNKTRMRDQITAAKKVRIQELRALIWRYWETHPCVDCGETDPLVLEFDHVRGKKVREIVTLAYRACSVETLKKEIAKCDVRCANCHSRKTAKQRGYWADFLGH